MQNCRNWTLEKTAGTSAQTHVCLLGIYSTLVPNNLACFRCTGTHSSLVWSISLQARKSSHHYMNCLYSLSRVFTILAKSSWVKGQLSLKWIFCCVVENCQSGQHAGLSWVVDVSALQCCARKINNITQFPHKSHRHSRFASMHASTCCMRSPFSSSNTLMKVDMWSLARRSLGPICFFRVTHDWLQMQMTGV